MSDRTIPPRLYSTDGVRVLQAVVSNEDGALRDSHGNALPPCIVMEKGESLDLWMKRNRRAMDPFTCMQVRAPHLASRLPAQHCYATLMGCTNSTTRLRGGHDC